MSDVDAPRDHGAGVAGPRTGRDPWNWWLPVAVVTVLALAAVLVWWGSEAILSSTSGNLLRTIDDPAQPGFEALVEPTPVMAVLTVDGDGALGAVSVLSLTGPTQGAVITADPGVVAVDPQGQPRTLGAAWQDEGASAVRAGIGTVLNVGISEERLIDAAQWADLVAPVAPLTVTNPGVHVGRGPDGATVRFPAGEIDLAADEVGTFLGPSADDEDDASRLLRLEALWAGWIAAVGEGIAAPGVVPGEAQTGLGRFVRALAGVQVELATLPVAPAAVPGGGVVLRPVETETATLVSRLVPFPVGAAPNSRLRVRILDGSGQLSNGLPAAPPLVVAGAEVATVGNATRFDYPTTQFIVPPGVDAARVEQMRAQLGVGEVVASAESASAVDVTVVLGADAVAPLGGPFPPPTTVAGASRGS